MLIDRTLHAPGFLSNTYLVARRAGGAAVLDRRRRPGRRRCSTRSSASGSTLTHVLLTHHHHDHVAELDAAARALSRRSPCWSTRDERARRGRDGRRSTPGETLDRRRPAVEPLHTPGHTAGMLALPRRRQTSSPATRSSRARSAACARPGHTTYEDLKPSIMDKLLALPPETRVHPGHTDPTTVGDELGAQRVRARLARPRPRGRRAVHRAGRAGDADPARRRLRRRPQGVGPLARRRATTSCPARRSQRGLPHRAAG